VNEEKWLPLSEVTVSGDPAGHESLHAGDRCNPLERHSLHPSHSPVHHSHQVCEAIFGHRQGTHQVHVNVAEPLYGMGLGWTEA
jgi:hypothetical protein